MHLFVAEDGFVHLFGTDALGRDVFTRTLFGSRTSLSIGFIGVIIAFVVGLIIGGVSGYFGGFLDNLLQRVIEFIRSIPTLPLWMSLAAVLPKEWSPLRVYFAVTIILGFLTWTTLARTRARKAHLHARRRFCVCCPHWLAAVMRASFGATCCLHF